MVDALYPGNLNFPIWPDTGVEPTDLSRFTYKGGVQPVAEIDSWWNRQVSEATHENRDLIEGHVPRHAAGGPDELNLQNLNIGTSATLTQPTSGRAAIHPGTDPTVGDPFIGFDAGTGTIDALQPISARVTAQNGLTVSGGTVDVSAQDIVAGDLTIWSGSADEVPQPQLGGPASQLTSYPLPNQDLANSSISITGDGAISVSQTNVPLGGSTSISFAGSGDLVTEHELATEWFDYAEGGVAEVGDVHYVGILSLSPNDTIRVWRASLMANNLGPVPVGIDLVLARGDPTDDAGEQSLTHLQTILEGDGQTRYDGVLPSGTSPLAEWTNTLSDTVTVFVGVDNGDSQIGLSGSGGAHEVIASCVCQEVQ